MMPIGHKSSDPALAESIDDFNKRLAAHDAAALDLTQPPELDDGGLLMLTVRGMELHRAGTLRERLKYRQNTVKLAREQVELLEVIVVELESPAARAEHARLVSLAKLALIDARQDLRAFVNAYVEGRRG